MRHVCGHTNHHTTVVHTFLESQSNLDVYPGIRFAYSKRFVGNGVQKCTIWLCNTRERVHGVTFAGKFALLAKIVEIDVFELGTQNNKICSCGPDRRCSSPTNDTFFLFVLVCKASCDFFSFSVSEKSGKIEVQKRKISRLAVLLCRPRRGPLRHVCGHTNHLTTAIHTCFKVHPT